MTKVEARKTLHRQVVVQIMKEEGQPYYLVEWPPYCLVSLKEILEGQRFLREINDMVNCPHCAYYDRKCLPDKERLYSRRIELE